MVAVVPSVNALGPHGWQGGGHQFQPFWSKNLSFWNHEKLASRFIKIYWVYQLASFILHIFHISVYYLWESLGTVVLKRHQSCCLWTTTGCIPVGWRWAAKDFLRQMDQHELLLCKAREEQYGIREVGRYPSILTNTPGQPRSRSSPAIHFRCLASKKPGNPMKCPEILQKHHANSGSVNSCPLNREATSFTKNSESWASAAPSSVHGSNPFETLSSPSPEEQSSGLQTAAPGGSKFQTRTQEKFRKIFLYGLSISWGTQFYPYVYIRMYIHTYIYIYLFIHWLWGIISIRSRGAPTTSSALQFQNALHAAVAGDGDTGIVAHVQGQNGLLFAFHLRFAKSAKSMTVSGHLRSPYGEVSKVMYPRLPSSKQT